jgi:hypothetical protein
VFEAIPGDRQADEVLQVPYQNDRGVPYNTRWNGTLQEVFENRRELVRHLLCQSRSVIQLENEETLSCPTNEFWQSFWF